MVRKSHSNAKANVILTSANLNESLLVEEISNLFITTHTVTENVTLCVGA